MKLSQVYRRAAELLAPEGAWGQGEGEDATPPPGTQCMRQVLGRLGTGADSWTDLVEEMSWNDAPDTTQADVVTYLLLASEALKAEGR